ncbi:N-acetyltransferase [Paractinoplanes durhamensis]|uniref:N-acetyltransferase n=1 Tax=Paractinoplanes durhamensis TaxID=113563 RepID=A0ABQ3ZAG5_9ACTN|nr:N-acetyltransferase [Actinoplanes durhamensis]
MRTATLADAEAVARVNIESWRKAYRGKMPQTHLDALDPAERTSTWQEWLTLNAGGIFVLDDPAEGVVGYVSVGASRDPAADPATTGQVWAIYVAPGHWGRGGGRLLMATAVDRLAALGFREATLWVLDTNERARHFYEAAGWRPDGTTKPGNARGFPLPELRYRTDLPLHHCPPPA